MAASPFVAIWCQPSYAARHTQVEWTIPATYAGGAVYVYRSLTGVAPWECLNASAPAAITDNFRDEELVVDNRVQVVHYRLMLEFGNERFGSEPINLLQKLTRSQYGAARFMMIRELEWMRKGNGIPAYHYLLSPGALDTIDSRTTQTALVPCPGSGLSGFTAGIPTWIRLEPTTVTVSDRPEGDGAVYSATTKARMLSWPRPVRGHVIVDPFSDDRYAVADTVYEYKWRGIVPIAYDVTLQLLGRQDDRYQLPVPNNHPDL